MIPDSELDDVIKRRLDSHRSPVPEDMWDRIVKKDRDKKVLFLFFKRLGLLIISIAITILLVQTGFRKASADKKQQAGVQNTSLQPDSPISLKQKEIREPEKIVSGSVKFPDSDDQYQTKKFAILTIRKSHGTSFSKVQMRKSGNIFTEFNSDRKVTGDAQAAQVTFSKGKNIENKTSTFNSEVEENQGTNDSASGNSNKSQAVQDSALMVSQKLATTKSSADSILRKNDTTKSGKKKWALDVYISPDFPIYKGGSLANRQFSYTAGFKLTRYFGSRFSAKIGIQYSMINLGGDSAGGRYLVHSFDIPVLGGYSFGKGNMKWTVNTGVIFNLNTWSKSIYPNIFKSNTGLSLYLGLNYERPLKERLFVFGEPYFRYRLTPMTVDFYSYYNYVNVAGLNLGVRYKF